MSKPRIFGQQVTVRLLNSKGDVPYLVTFDSIDISDMSETKTFKSIGKNRIQSETISKGYRITLNRTKRDNALIAFSNHISMMVEKGLASPEFSIEYTVNHYVENMDVDYIIDDKTNGVNLFQQALNFIGTKVGGIVGNALEVAGDEAKENFNKASDFVADARRAISPLTHLASDIANIFFRKDGFKEKIILKNCTKGEMRTGVSSHNEVVEESLTLTASHIVVDSDSGEYEDGYLPENFIKDYVSKFVNQNIDDGYLRGNPDTIANKDIADSFIKWIK